MRRAALLMPGMLLLAPAALPDPERNEGIVVNHLFTGSEWTGPSVITTEGGKVAGIRKGDPDGRRDTWATPGWIDAASTTGLAGADAEMTRESTPCVRPLRLYDPGDPGVRRALASGVTSILLEPGSGNVVAGIASVVKTAAGPKGEARVVREVAALRIALGSDPSSGNSAAHGMPLSIYARRPTTRMGVLAILRDAWLLGKAAGPDAPDADRAAMARAAAGEIPVRVLARHAEDLRTALKVSADLGFRPVLEGAAEGFLVADRLVAAKAECVVGPLLHAANARGVEGTVLALGNAGTLHRAGVPLALTAAGEAWRLREQAALAVRFGLPRDAALRAVTSEAARLCGVQDRLGSLAPGRDADLVVFDGDPLEPSSRVLRVIVDGETVYEAEERK